MTRSAGSLLIVLLALIAIGLAAINLERGRSGLEISDMEIGSTPATLYREPGARGPLVVVAHGFAGSRQLMQGYSLTLAQAGYTVLAFDFEGHGRNPTPMSGDLMAVDGATRRLVAETRRVIAAGRDLPEVAGGVALLGHSMATDIIVRAAIDEAEAGDPVDAVVAISMFSGAVTPLRPRRLLAITGEWESGLRAAALDILRQVEPGADEGETVGEDGVLRRAVVAPGVEHVGVLFSAAALAETRDWLDDAFGRESAAAIVAPGPWILLLLGGIVALLHPLIGLLPRSPAPPIAVSARRLWAAVAAPAVVTPLVGVALYIPFLPVLVADYLMIHLAVYGGLQLVLLRVWRRTGGVSISAAAMLAIWGVVVFGLAMDRYVASFAPNAERLTLIALLCVGAIPFMAADSYISGAGCGVLWRRIAARAAFFLSLGGAAALDPERLLFLFIILPVIALFFLIHGLMGRWVARRSGPLSAGVGLGLCLAWALGVSFPLFSPG